MQSRAEGDILHILIVLAYVESNWPEDPCEEGLIA